MKKAIFLLAAMATTLLSNAQKANNDNSVLWKIEGNGIEKPSYLLGTIHMICAPDFEIKEKVSKAFAATTNLVLEVNTTDPNEIQAMQKMMQSETTLSSRLSETERKDVNELLTSQIGVTLAQADHVSPAGLLSIAVMTAMTCPPAEMKSYEAELTIMAQAQQKPISGLETINGQINIIDKAYSLNDILGQIKIKNEYGVVLADMARFHKEENLPELYKTVLDRRFMSADAEKLMLTDRNKEWVKKIPALVKKESTFFAVGAGHLYGKTGVIELLRQQGYKVTPVK